MKASTWLEWVSHTYPRYPFCRNQDLKQLLMPMSQWALQRKTCQGKPHELQSFPLILAVYCDREYWKESAWCYLIKFKAQRLNCFALVLPGIISMYVLSQTLPLSSLQKRMVFSNDSTIYGLWKNKWNILSCVYPNVVSQTMTSKCGKNVKNDLRKSKGGGGVRSDVNLTGSSTRFCYVNCL